MVRAGVHLLYAAAPSRCCCCFCGVVASSARRRCCFCCDCFVNVILPPGCAGVRVFIAPNALMQVIGTEMDWVEDKLSAQFVFNNPNAVSVCGCGESFST